MAHILQHETQKNTGEMAISKILTKIIQVLTKCNYIFRWMHTHLLSGRIKSTFPSYGVVCSGRPRSHVSINFHYHAGKPSVARARKHQKYLNVSIPDVDSISSTFMCMWRLRQRRFYTHARNQKPSQKVEYHLSVDKDPVLQRRYAKCIAL
jgi:hypothetical protein